MEKADGEDLLQVIFLDTAEGKIVLFKNLALSVFSLVQISVLQEI